MRQNILQGEKNTQVVQGKNKSLPSKSTNQV